MVRIYNLLHQNVILNRNLLLLISNKFIHEDISLRVIIMENNSFERKGYGTNLVKNNKENNLYYIIKFVNNNKLVILNGFIYININ